MLSISRFVRPSVRLYICPSVRLSVCLFTFEVLFNGLFAPTSQSRMSNIFSDSESLGKSNGKKWSNIWTFVFGSGLKLPRKKKVFFVCWFCLGPPSYGLWHRCYYPHRSRDALSPVCGIFKECKPLLPSPRGPGHSVSGCTEATEDWPHHHHTRDQVVTNILIICHISSEILEKCNNQISKWYVSCKAHVNLYTSEVLDPNIKSPRNYHLQPPHALKTLLPSVKSVTHHSISHIYLSLRTPNVWSSQGVGISVVGTAQVRLEGSG